MTGSTVLAIDLAPEKRRGEAASYIFVSFHLGLGLGPVLGEAVLAHGSYHRVFAWLTGLMVAGAVVALFLPYRPGHPGAPPSPLIHRNALVPGTVVALGMVGFVAFSTFVPLYGREIGMNHIGPVFVVASISIAVVRVVFGKLPDRLGPVRATSIALALTVAGAVLVSVWGAAVGVYLAAGVFAGGLALQTPSLIPVAVHGVAPHERAAAMSTFTMFMDLSSALTGPLFGVIASGVGYRATFLTTGVCAVAAAVVLHRSLAPRWRAVTATSAVPSAVTR
jgi:predicted MFS family arabinose efflux permease